MSGATKELAGGGPCGSRGVRGLPGPALPRQLSAADRYREREIDIHYVYTRTHIYIYIYIYTHTKKEYIYIYIYIYIYGHVCVNSEAL